jgi:hypothetical protein
VIGMTLVNVQFILERDGMLPWGSAFCGSPHGHLSLLKPGLRSTSAHSRGRRRSGLMSS